MNYDNDSLIEATLGALISIMKENHTLFINNIETILERLLTVALREQNSYETRIAISRTFGVICKMYYEPNSLVSYKKRVFKALGLMVGDKKRGVRNEAANARLIWHLQS